MLELLSGHDAGAQDGHPSYLPYDGDGDGAIDRLLIHLPLGLDDVAIAGLKAVRRLWLGSEGEWEVRLERVGGREDFASYPYFGRGREWASVTPWLHPWYRKKGFGRAEQLQRECRLRGWPEPTLERLDKILVGNQLEPIS
jgi:CRISPR-associated protein Csb2